MSAYIDELISKLSAKYQEQEGSLDKSIKFDLTDEGTFIVEGRDIAKCEPDKEAACTLVLTKETLDEVIAGTLNPMMAVMGGKIKLEGDMMAAMALKDLL